MLGPDHTHSREFNMRRSILVAAVALLAACDSVTAPGYPTDPGSADNTAGSPVIAPLDAAYVPAIPGDTSFWAVKGQALDVVLRFRSSNGQPGDQLLEFSLSANSLLEHPDGSPFAAGDSVLITIHPDSTGKMTFEFQPSGLVFDPSAPATLRMWCTHAAADLNGDGVVDSTDEHLWYTMKIWMREHASDPLTALPTTRSQDGEELEAPVGGFTGFSVAS